MASADPANALAEAVGRELSEVDHLLMGLLGLKIEAMRPNEAVVSMTVRPDMVNSHGYCHGGLLFALADHAFAYASASTNRAGVTLSAHITYSKPARLGDQLRGIGRVTVDGGRIATCRVDVLNQDDLILAQFQGVNYRTKESVVPWPEDSQT